MSGRRRRRPEQTAGAFLGPDILIAAPTRTLSDEYRDVPVEPEDDHVPEPEPPTLIHRVIDRLRRHPDGGVRPD